MKYIILVGDGMGDHPIAELDNKTPLQAAKTPTMDHIASHGELHLLQTVPDGYAPGSDVANLSLLGYLPDECYSGRAPLEAASMGVDLAGDEIAFRCNLVTVSHDAEKVIMEDYSGGHITTEEAHELITSIAEAVSSDKLTFYPGISYRHLMVHKGELADLVTVPPHDYTGKDVTEFWQRYQKVPYLHEAMTQAQEILATHPVNTKRVQQGKNPANAIWLWGEGNAPAMRTLEEQYNVSGSLISAVDLLKGIGVYAGMEIIDVPGATGYLDTNYQGKATAAMDALKEKDLVFVHVEAPDEAGHQGLLKEKIQAIEDFDAKIVQPIFDWAKAQEEPFRLAVAMDHFTPLAIRTHSAESVPIAIYDSQKQQASANTFCEEDANKEDDLIVNGSEFIKKILQ